MMSSCTLGLLMAASHLSYNVEKDGTLKIDKADKDAASAADSINNHDYNITQKVAERGNKSLVALCMEPKDDKGPIIIAFRGTSSIRDFSSDLTLGVFGVTEKARRDAAFNLYQQIRAKHPNREIVLTGHSLGGNFANYIGSKAYNLNPALEDKLLQVRTFNAAPMQTKHEKVFQESPHLLSRFVSYRLSSDVVSKLPLQKYLGNVFVFRCDKLPLSAHFLTTMKQYIPESTLNMSVGSNEKASSSHHLLLETISGILSSYQSRVQGQFFSRYRSGAKNWAIIEKELPHIMNLITQQKYGEVAAKFSYFKQILKGPTASRMLGIAIRHVDATKKEMKEGVYNNQENKALDHQKSIKEQLKSMTHAAVVDKDEMQIPFNSIKP